MAESDMEDDMMEVLASIKEREGEGAEVEEKPEEEKTERERDESGKFKAKEEPAPEVEEEIQLEVEPTPDPEVIDQEAAASEPESVQVSEFPNAPDSWTAEGKARWANQSEDDRREIHRREQASIEGVEQLKASAEYGNRISRQIEPYHETIKDAGVSEEEAIGVMASAFHTLRTAHPMEKGATLMGTAVQYGCMNELLMNYGQQYGCINEVQALISRNPQPQQMAPQGLSQQDVKNQVEQILSQRDEQSEAERAAEAVTTFATATDSEGKLEHPYFENVRLQMTGIVQAAEASGTPVSLEQAYDQAIWAHPEIRPLLVAQQAQKEEAERSSQEQARIEAASKANKARVREKPSHSADQPSPTGSIDDTLNETLSKINSRAA